MKVFATTVNTFRALSKTSLKSHIATTVAIRHNISIISKSMLNLYMKEFVIIVQNVITILLRNANLNNILKRNTREFIIAVINVSTRQQRKKNLNNILNLNMRAFIIAVTNVIINPVGNLN